MEQVSEAFEDPEAVFEGFQKPCNALRVLFEEVGEGVNSARDDRRDRIGNMGQTRGEGLGQLRVVFKGLLQAFTGSGDNPQSFGLPPRLSENIARRGEQGFLKRLESIAEGYLDIEDLIIELIDSLSRFIQLPFDGAQPCRKGQGKITTSDLTSRYQFNQFGGGDA